jgi:hypothetical protein
MAAHAHSRMDRSCGVILTVLEDCPTGRPGSACLGDTWSREAARGWRLTCSDETGEGRWRTSWSR